MTTSVINTLDTINTSFNSITDTSSISDTLPNNFSKILDVQSVQAADSNSSVQLADLSLNEQAAVNTAKESISTIGTLKNSILDSAKEISTILSEVLKEAELPIDFTIVQDDNTISENEIELNIDNKDDILFEQDTNSNTDTTSQKTITNEDSTMMQEQILTPNPENLLTFNVFNLQQQPQKSIDTENNTEYLKDYATQTNLGIQKENTSFSQFDMLKKESEQLITEDIPEDDEAVVKTTPSKLSDIIDDSIAEELNIESVETDVGGNQNQSSDLMQNQSPQEHSIKAVIQSEVKFDDLRLNVTSQTKNSQTEINAGRILEQISKHMENMHNGSKVNIVLNPESLGKISIQLLNSKEGLMAQFTVTSQDVKDILMKGLAGLKESLLAQGVSVDNVTVKLSDSGDSEYQGDWTDREDSQGGFKEHNAKHKKDDKKQFEQMMFEIENNDNV